MRSPFRGGAEMRATPTIALIVTILGGCAPPLSEEAAPVSAAPGLVAAYAFDEGVGALASDSSGNGLSGSVANAPWVQGRFGSALRFGSGNAMVSVPDHPLLDLTTGMTVEAWAYRTGSLATWPTVVMKEGSSLM